ncbi:MAG: NAD-dependent deacetylase [Spirochaetaceae bacterium]|jgi:NAD-dependent deacetylase|nr:NAD-dependent deacetylase [Spirochaetaceae bacterium]
MRERIDALFSMIKNARHCTALTGAGVSTLSGIRDFRGKNGLYNDMDAEKIFDIAYFEHDPTFYYEKARHFIYNVDEKPASVVHTTLALLEARGFLKALITQNIDLLHQKGGSKRVIEVHGSPATHYCLRCAGVRVPFEQARAALDAGDYPRCPSCGAILKPAITFFGEALPAAALRDAENEASASDLMLVLGTSLTVNPAAGIPRSTLRCGGKLVIVNNQPTPLDSSAVLRFDELEPVFTALAEAAGAPGAV